MSTALLTTPQSEMYKQFINVCMQPADIDKHFRVQCTSCMSCKTCKELQNMKCDTLSDLQEQLLFNELVTFEEDQVTGKGHFQSPLHSL